jgi:AcrR family transcriptional regulator
MNTRERIVNTASRLFYTQGYNSTGINQVIKEAEIAKASLYQHFPSKEDLLIEYLKVTSESTGKLLRAQVAKHKLPREKVLSLFDFLAKFARQTEFNGCNFLNVASELPNNDEKVKALIRKQKNEVRALFAEILKPAGKEELADELYLLFDAALIASKVHGDLWPVRTAKRVVEKLV